MCLMISCFQIIPLDFFHRENCDSSLNRAKWVWFDTKWAWSENFHARFACNRIFSPPTFNIFLYLYALYMFTPLLLYTLFLLLLCVHLQCHVFGVTLRWLMVRILSTCLWSICYHEWFLCCVYMCVEWVPWIKLWIPLINSASAHNARWSLNSSAQVKLPGPRCKLLQYPVSSLLDLAGADPENLHGRWLTGWLPIVNHTGA